MSHPGQALNATVIDTGVGFKMIVNPVEVSTPSEQLPHLPVARALWNPLPDLATSAEAWIQAGGAHHTAFSYDVPTEQLTDFCAIAGIECQVIS
jgi:L-arabinose isomerase